METTTAHRRRRTTGPFIEMLSRSYKRAQLVFKSVKIHAITP